MFSVLDEMTDSQAEKAHAEQTGLGTAWMGPTHTCWVLASLGIRLSALQLPLLEPKFIGKFYLAVRNY